MPPYPLSKQNLLRLWEKYQFRPSPQWGQNFLINEKIAKIMVETLALDPSETVYEIGPGFGALTHLLIKRAKKVIAIEKDKRLVAILRDIFSQEANLDIVQGDILTFLSSSHPRGKFIGNPPYYLSSSLLRQLLSFQPRPKLIVLTLQKEVGEKIMAQPPKANHLSILVQLASQVTPIATVDREFFWPSPLVDSQVLKIQPLDLPPLKPQSLTVLKQAFATPRKTLLNNLSCQLFRERKKLQTYLREEGIDPSRRPGSLQLEEWKKLFNLFEKLA